MGLAGFGSRVASGRSLEPFPLPVEWGRGCLLPALHLRVAVTRVVFPARARCVGSASWPAGSRQSGDSFVEVSPRVEGRAGARQGGEGKARVSLQGLASRLGAGRGRQSREVGGRAAPGRGHAGAGAGQAEESSGPWPSRWVMLRGSRPYLCPGVTQGRLLALSTQKTRRDRAEEQPPMGVTRRQ